MYKVERKGVEKHEIPKIIRKLFTTFIIYKSLYIRLVALKLAKVGVGRPSI